MGTSRKMLSYTWQRAALSWGSSSASGPRALLDCGGGAQDLPRSALLDLGDVKLEEVVEPLHQLVPASRGFCQLASGECVAVDVVAISV